MRKVLLTILFVLVIRDVSGEIPRVTAVDSVSLTVSDMDESVDFYTHVLTFEKIADRELTGEEYERPWGVFGLRLHERNGRLFLGIDHTAIVVADTEASRPGARP